MPAQLGYLILLTRVILFTRASETISHYGSIISINVTIFLHLSGRRTKVNWDFPNGSVKADFLPKYIYTPIDKLILVIRL